MSNFKWPYLRYGPNGSSDTLHVWFYSFRVGGSNGVISGYFRFDQIHYNMAAGRHLGKLQWHRAISL